MFFFCIEDTSLFNFVWILYAMYSDTQLFFFVQNIFLYIKRSSFLYEEYSVAIVSK